MVREPSPGKRALSLAGVCVALSALLAACSSGATAAPSPSQNPSVAPASASAASESAPASATPVPSAASTPVKVALVATQAPGDKGPIDDMIAFLAKAKADSNLDTKFIYAQDPASYEATLRNLANSGTNIIATTFNEMSKPIAAVAKDFPNVKFIQIYGDPLDPPMANVRTVSYDYYIGSYLAGLAAATVSKTGKLGYIGGQSIPSINIDVNSFIAAAKATKPSTTVQSAFVGSFQDPTKEHSLASAMYANGVDFIMTDAAASDLGAVQAAKEKKGFVIGGAEAVESAGPTTVAGIVILRFGQSLYDQLKDALSPSFQGGHVKSGLKDNIVDFLVSPQFVSQGPADIMAALQGVMPAVTKAKQDIISGALVVPADTNAP